MADSTDRSGKAGFLSLFLPLAREIRDLVYGHLLVSKRGPIYFDPVNGFMPAEVAIQEGLPFVTSRSAPMLIVVEAPEIFYKSNTITVRCEDIGDLLHYRAFQNIKQHSSDPSDSIKSLVILVDGRDWGEFQMEDPTVGLQKLLDCTALKAVQIEIRGEYATPNEISQTVTSIFPSCNRLRQRLGPGLSVYIQGVCHSRSSRPYFTFSRVDISTLLPNEPGEDLQEITHSMVYALLGNPPV